MKYIIVFLVVFLTGFGLLQLFNPKEAPPQQTTEKESDLISMDSIGLKTNELEDTASSVPVLVDGHYNIGWKHLSKVDFEERLNEEFKTMIAYPVFHPSVKKLDGQKIQIKGYVIPLEETGDETIVVLSAFPFTSCFFCGGAGPESVMDIQLKKRKKRFKQDAMVTFRGKLRLNDSDLDYLNYILDDAVVYEE